MSSHDEEIWNESGAFDTAYVVGGAPSMHAFQQVTTKIPPSFDGRSSWFAYEEAIDDWCDVTELDTDKQGPALRNRLDGEAAIYKSLLDRNALKDPNNGVDYFKRELRPHFVKGSQSVFLWRFFQLFKAHRGQQDFLRWIGRISVLRKRLAEAWMDLIDPVDQTNPDFQQFFQNLTQQGGGYDPAVELGTFNAARIAAHQAAFPINDNLFALILTV